MLQDFAYLFAKYDRVKLACVAVCMAIVSAIESNSFPFVG